MPSVHSRANRGDSFDLVAMRRRLQSKIENDDYDVNAEEMMETISRNPSPLQRWCAFPLTYSSSQEKSINQFRKKEAEFPLLKIVDQVVTALEEFDVVVLVAPTGTGKSLLAPYIAELFARCSKTHEGFRKSLLVGPNAEHAGSTARTFSKIFNETNLVSYFLNPYDGYNPHRRNLSDDFGPEDIDFIFTAYNAAIRVLPHSNLNLLFLDEVHEPNDNVQVAIAMAVKMIKGSKSGCSKMGYGTTQSLNKLVLMSATLDENKMRRYRKYFSSQRLSFKSLDFTDTLDRNKELFMSCLFREDTVEELVLPEMFEKTKMSKDISRDFQSNGLLELRAKKERGVDVLIFDRLKKSLNYVLEKAWGNLRTKHMNTQEDGGKCDMESIVVILPGMELVDRMYSSVFELSHFSYKGQPGFHPVRMTSLVKDDENITSKCTRNGDWGGCLGRIVFTTNFVSSGLTVPNAAFVIDSGRQKMLNEYTMNGLRSLETIWIDKSMMIQRAGRTGRTTDGEYFLPYSVEKVDEMVNTDHGEILLHRNFDERHMIYKEMYKLKLLYEPPEILRTELLRSMEIRGLYNSDTKQFPNDVILMNSLCNFLPPEYARIIVQGTRLGIAAHCVLIVSHYLSKVKFCQVGTKGRGENNGPSPSKSAIDLYCEAMENKRKLGVEPSSLPATYRGVGDSIALADLLASFFSVVRGETYRSALQRYSVPSTNFWSGDDQLNLTQLYPAFVREEGRDAVSRNFVQCQKALVAAGVIHSKLSIFDHSINRYIVSEENFCLDQNGRAMFSALLTMHSSRIGEFTSDKYIVSKDPKNLPKIAPDSAYTQDSSMKYWRYIELFELGGVYRGLIDPITPMQLIHFININGMPNYGKLLTHGNNTITHTLCASPEGNSFKFTPANSYATLANVKLVRSAVQRGIKMLTYTSDQSLIQDLEYYIINAWKGCAHSLDGQMDDFF